MTKTAARPGPFPKPAAAEKSSDKEQEKPKETLRDFVEQIVVAILLALLIRGFDAEAFVIPTGSMAPTLMGRHKEITCPQCGNVYSVNSSEEIEGNPNIPLKVRSTEAAVCVNCRFPANIFDEPSFKGDRILVMKFPYELPWLPGAGGPKRWDVVVFHYPEKPEQNYIKRLVGLPSEDLKIYRGDIFVRPTGDGPFQIARKPSSRLQAMAILVNDDNHRAKLLKDNPDWLRWKPTEGWKEEGETSVFTFSGGANSPAGNLRYRHLVPDPEQWQAIWDKAPLPRAPRPTLITDFSSYNASTLSDQNDPQAAWLQSHWVSDLLLEFELDIQKVDDGVFTIELVAAGVKNRCVIDPKTGMASLYHGDTKLGEVKTSVAGTGRHSIGFANVDDRLTLWVDGRTPFGDGLSYEDGPGTSYAPTAADLDPVGISASGMSVKVSGLVLKRDIYYTRDPRETDFAIPGPPPTFEPPGQRRSPFARVVGLFDVLADPSRFSTWLAEPEPGDVYSIRSDHFMMMGDNSPRSFDGRAWGRGDQRWDHDRQRWEVPRSLLIGKAFFVYWPHGVPFWFDIRVSHDFRIPFRPYFERMKPIR
jgi:signal peptidase I